MAIVVFADSAAHAKLLKQNHQLTCGQSGDFRGSFEGGFALSVFLYGEKDSAARHEVANGLRQIASLFAPESPQPSKTVSGPDKICAPVSRRHIPRALHSYSRF
ncbi:MAG: hypothetical protein WBC92_02640 [Terracidiphilus sp.]